MEKKGQADKKYWKNVLALQKYVWKFAPELFFIRSIKIGCQLISNVLVYEFMVKKVLDAITRNQDFKSVVSYILWVSLWMFSFDLINNIYILKPPFRHGKESSDCVRKNGAARKAKRWMSPQGKSQDCGN